MNPDVRPKGLDHPLVPRVMQLMSRANVWLYQRTGGRIGGTWRMGSAFPRGVPVLLLTTTGRKTGRKRTTPLLYIEDGDALVVVASRGGLREDPKWFLNLRDQPEVEVQVGPRKDRRRARVANPAERERLWPRLVAHYRDFATYQAWTERQIPVILLAPINS
jgi:deazaflavin-dependent oxidoreductase (nitroreductase family)